MNLYFQSKLRDKYDKESAEYQLSYFVFRQWWHFLYDFTPTLREELKTHESKYLENMISKMFKNKQLDKFFHLRMIENIKNDSFFSKKDEIINELITAQCIYWIRSDFSYNNTMLVYLKDKDMIYCGRKSLRLGLEPTVEQFEMEYKLKKVSAKLTMFQTQIIEDNDESKLLDHLTDRNKCYAC